MTHHDRNAHREWVATPRGLAIRNTPALPLKREPRPRLSAFTVCTLVCALGLALFWSI